MKNKKIKISSNRSFGLVFCAIFLIISIWPLLDDKDIRIWSLIISLIFLKDLYFLLTFHTDISKIKSVKLKVISKLWSNKSDKTGDNTILSIHNLTWLNTLSQCSLDLAPDFSNNNIRRESALFSHPEWPDEHFQK